MKNNKHIKVIVLATILVIGGITFFILNASKEKTTKLADFNFAGGVRCVQTNVIDKDNSITNTMYFYKNQMRYDTQLGSGAQLQKDMHIISDGEKSYIWGKGDITTAFGGDESTGIIVSSEDDSDMARPPVTIKEIKKSGTNGIPGLKCEDWDPDQNMFKLPEGIKFVEMKDMMNPQNVMQNNSNTSGAKGMDCSVCNSIPDTVSKNSCLQSLGCE